MSMALTPITAIRAEYPRARIVVLTSWAADIQVLRALKAGAVGYLLKSMFAHRVD